jgi:hypothetical protein
MGCAKENEVPAYLYIGSYNTTTVFGQGSANQKITDIWVYVDGQAQGIYPLPAHFPVVDLGKHEIQVLPGVRNNGIKSNPIIYPFLKPYKINLELKSGKTDTLRPTTTYVEGDIFKMMEDFESGNSVTVDRAGGTSPIRFAQTLNGFEGKGASLSVSKSNPLFEVATVGKAKLPDNATSIFLEMHYKTGTPLSVGVIGSSPSNSTGITSYKIVLFPNTEWNKIYLNLTNEVKDLRQTDFQIVFRSLLPDSIPQATVQIDNLKLLQK